MTPLVLMIILLICAIVLFFSVKSIQGSSKWMVLIVGIILAAISVYGILTYFI